MSGAKNLRVQQSFEILDALALIKPNNITLSFSHQSEDVVVLDLLTRAGFSFTVFTLDTMKLFGDSLEYEKEIERFFGIEIQRYYPQTSSLAKLMQSVGDDGIYESVEKRKECCRVRKEEPLREALRGKEVWVSGVRRSQSITRSDFSFMERDENLGLLKVSPILDWSKEEVNAYLTGRGIPKNPLYARGFTSIGCEPCTRATLEGESERAGRWWWEDESHKECGLHRRK